MRDNYLFARAPFLSSSLALDVARTRELNWVAALNERAPRYLRYCPCLVAVLFDLRGVEAWLEKPVVMRGICCVKGKFCFCWHLLKRSGFEHVCIRPQGQGYTDDVLFFAVTRGCK